MTPEEYAAQALVFFLAANGRVPEADHSLFESAVTHYVRAAIEADRTKMERYLIDVRLRYTEGEYAVGWNNAIESALNFLDTSNPA